MLKKKIKFPDTYVFVFAFIVIAAILTYIVPAGVYDTYKNSVGKDVVDPSTFHFVAQTPVSLSAFFTAPFDGLQNGSSTIFLILLIGGFFGIINSTGAIDGAFHAAINKLKDKALLVLPAIMITIAVLGSLQIVSNAIIAFIAIGIVLCKRLKLDPLLVMAVIFVPNQVGFATTSMGAFTVLVAQQISEVTPMSGSAYRMVFAFIALGLDIAWTMWYAVKITKNPEKSLIGVYEEDPNEEISEGSFTLTHIIILITLFGAFFLYGWGAVTKNWGTDILSAILLAVSLLAGIIAREGANDMAKAFVSGAKDVLYGALMVGLAGAILIMLKDGQIIHTIIHYASMPLQHLPKAISAIGMFVVNAIFNFIVPSGSGQAYIVMPLMAPLADILGISRQVAILAYQYGDGFTNIIIPTGGTTMACVAMCGIPYSKWIKFIIPLYGLLCLVAVVAITLGIVVGL
ncbi:MAG: YfcC family protein [Oscillospiraceae bacterium]